MSHKITIHIPKNAIQSKKISKIHPRIIVQTWNKSIIMYKQQTKNVQVTKYETNKEWNSDNDHKPEHDQMDYNEQD